MTSRCTVSIVIPTYRRAQRLRETVEAALESGADEVVVVVDGARDGSLELLEDISAEDPRLVPCFQENAGAAAARARGVEVASGEVVLFLDDDVHATPGLAEGHALRHANEDGLVVLGAMPTPVPGRSAGTFSTELYAAEYERVRRTWGQDPSQVLRSLWQGNVSMRRKDAIAVGMVNEAMPGGYHGDRDLGLRCLRRGLRGVFDPTLVAHHQHERSVRDFRRNAQDQGRSMWKVHDMHADLIGPMPDDFYLQGLPSVLMPVVRWAIRGRTGQVTGRSLQVLTELAGRLHLWRMEVVLGKVMRRIESQRSAWAVAKEESNDTCRTAKAA